MRHYGEKCENHFRSLREYNRFHRAKSAHALLLSVSAMQITPRYSLAENCRAEKNNKIKKELTIAPKKERGIRGMKF